MISQTEGKGKSGACELPPGIRHELGRFPHFVGYELVEKKNPDPDRPWKKDKIPVNARTGYNAATDKPASWAPYAVVQEALHTGFPKKRTVHGVGYVFWKGDPKNKTEVPADPYVGIDLDDCLDPESGALAPWAQEIVDDTDSYAEVSPSGRGIKIIMKGKLPGPGGKSTINKGIEMYDRARFFTLTGNHLPDTPSAIEERSEQIGPDIASLSPGAK